MVYDSCIILVIHESTMRSHFFNFVAEELDSNPEHKLCAH